MPYRRGTRPSLYFMGRTRAGWTQLCAFTPDKRLAEKIEAMWEELANEHRAWDILAHVLRHDMNAAELYDLWVDAKRNVRALRRHLADSDLAALVEPWREAYCKKVTTESANHALAHVRWLIAEGASLRATDATPDYLERRLGEYPGKRNTRRKVHSSWSVFFAYCVKPAHAIDVNPMLSVDRPKPEKSPIRFYELRDVERIVGWFDDEARRAYFALLYGTGMDVSDPLSLLRGDLIEHTHEIRAPGTKNHTRDRVAMIADWAWPIVWGYAKSMHPDARLFPETWNRWTIADWHRAAIGDGMKDTHGTIVAKGLKLPRRYPPKCARHHWAVRQLRAGAAIRVVSEQLGHSTQQLTLDVYGRFLSKTADRKRAEQQASRFDRAREKADQKEGRTSTGTSNEDAPRKPKGSRSA